MKKLFNRNYLLILQGNAVSALGDLLYSVAIGHWVYEKTGSSALMGFMSSIVLFVLMIGSPFAGSMVDRSDRKWVIVGMDVLRGILMLAVGALAFQNRLSVGAVLVTAFLSAVCSVFFSPAVQTALIDVIPRDDMVRGQSIHSSVTSLINLAGKAVSGLTVAFFGVPAIIVFNGICYLFSAFTELFIRLPRPEATGEKNRLADVLQDFLVGLRAVWADPLLRLFVPGILLINLLVGGAFSLILPFATQKGFSLEQYGYLMSAMTVATLVCMAGLSTVKLSAGIRYWAMTIGYSSFFFFYSVAYLSRSFGVILVMAFLGSLGNTLGNAIFNASLMLALPEKNRGAILGFITAASTGGNALSAVIYGLLGEVFPLHLVFLVGNVLGFAPVVYLVLHKTSKEFILSN